MANQNKVEVVKQLTDKFSKSSGIYFTKYTGLDVASVTELRRQFRDNGVDYFVSKNTLTKIAASNAGFEDRLDGFLVGQIGIAYAGEDPTAPAKTIKAFKKDNKDLLEVVGLVFEGEVYTSEKYIELASLPSREELLSKLVGGLNYPMGQLVGTLGGAMAKLVGVLSSLKENKS
tara:strand:+ start:408 stop:929 length:522 start_codon:yes stop_codon:yes gene_type:complete